MDRPRNQSQSAEEEARKIGGQVQSVDGGGQGSGPRFKWMSPFYRFVESGQFDDHLVGECLFCQAVGVWLDWFRAVSAVRLGFCLGSLPFLNTMLIVLRYSSQSRGMCDDCLFAFDVCRVPGTSPLASPPLFPRPPNSSASPSNPLTGPFNASSTLLNPASKPPDRK